jgi:hypothetical protein
MFFKKGKLLFSIFEQRLPMLPVLSQSLFLARIVDHITIRIPYQSTRKRDNFIKPKKNLFPISVPLISKSLLADGAHIQFSHQDMLTLQMQTHFLTLQVLRIQQPLQKLNTSPFFDRLLQSNKKKLVYSRDWHVIRQDRKHF